MKHKHGGNIDHIKEKYGLSKKEIIDFSVNTNFLGPPEGVYQILKSNAFNIERYPEANSTTLKQKIAGNLTKKSIYLQQDNIILGNGATEIIYQLVKLIMPKKALIVAPTFSEYKFAVNSVKGEVEYFLLNKNNKFRLNIDNLLKKITNKNYDMIFICNPNNPTGQLISKNKIEKLLNKLYQKNTYLVIDESFIDFVRQKSKNTVIKLIDEFENLFVIRSFTKIFSIPGIRLGYGIGAQKLIDKIEQNRDPWSVNIFAQKIGEKLINNNQFYQRSREKNFLEKDILYEFLNRIDGIEPIYSEANFILLNIAATDKTATEIEDELATRGIIIRNCNSFKILGEDYIRVAVKNRDDNLRLIENLELIIQGGG